MTIDDLKTYTYEEARRAFYDGRIGDGLWEQYCHLWQTSAPRFGLRACACDHCRATSAAWEGVSR